MYCTSRSGLKEEPIFKSCDYRLQAQSFPVGFLLIRWYFLCFPVFQPQFIRDQGDKFGVGGFAFSGIDRIAEKGVQSFHPSPAPCHLDGVADGTLHSARRGLVFVRDRRIEEFGDGI